MSKNFKRRYALLPNSNIDSEEKLSDLTEKSTFKRKSSFKGTPVKEKIISSSILETPTIKKDRLKRLTLYSPLSFGHFSPVNYNDEKQFHNDFSKLPYELKDNEEKKIFFINENIKPKKFAKFNSTSKMITNFNDSKNFQENYKDYKNINFELFFSEKKKFNNKFSLWSRDNSQKTFRLFNDYNILNKNKILNERELIMLNIWKDDDNDTDEEQIKQDRGICLRHLEEVISNKLNFYENKNTRLSINKNKVDIFLTPSKEDSEYTFMSL